MGLLNADKKGFTLSRGEGFTLIELLVVIAIIGILAGLIIVSTGNSRNRARDARREGDLRQITTAQELVMNDDGSYTKSAATGTIPAAVNTLGHQYLAPIVNPTNDNNYRYVWIANNAPCGSLDAGKYYCAVAKLEDKGICATGLTRYFAVNNKGSKEICANADYAANPPACDVCLAF